MTGTVTALRTLWPFGGKKRPLRAPWSADDQALLDLAQTNAVRLGTLEAGVRSGTLINLRWLAILGQVAAMTLVSQYLRFDVPLTQLWAGVAGAIVFNIALTVTFGQSIRLSSRQAGLHLVFDLIQLSYLLYFTGGLHNPFAVMMLLPLTIAATMLSARATVFMLALATACLLFLTRAHRPLPWAMNQPIELPSTYLLGLWASITISMVFIAIYTYRVSADARRRAESVVALQGALNREQRLAAVGSVAAAAAHELGTPLGTLSLIARDFRAQSSSYPELEDDFKLMFEETERCRDILADISRRAEDRQEHFRRMPIAAIVKEITENYQARGIDVQLTASSMDGDDSRSPVVMRAPELRHGIANIISNAVRFAKTTVYVDVSWDEDTVHILIGDDGPGFSDDVLSQIGKPFIGSQEGRDGQKGMGLGLFIAKTLLGRTGGVMDVENDEAGGAVVDVHWDRATIEEDGDTWDTKT